MREAHKFTAPTSRSALAISPTFECQRGRDIKHAWLSSSSLVGESSLCNITHSSEILYGVAWFAVFAGRRSGRTEGKSGGG